MQMELTICMDAVQWLLSCWLILVWLKPLHVCLGILKAFLTLMKRIDDLDVTWQDMYDTGTFVFVVVGRTWTQM